jgi:hypothetical protein
VARRRLTRKERIVRAVSLVVAGSMIGTLLAAFFFR